MKTTTKTSKQKSAPVSKEASKASQPMETLKVTMLQASLIKPSPTNQRTDTGLDEQSIDELASSIESVGLIQPLTVKPLGSKHYEIIAGERRYLACRKVGLKEIPCIIRDISEERALEIQIIENDQRRDLHVIERANGYKELLSRKGPDGKPLYTIDDAAEMLGKSKASIYGVLKLLDLDKEIQDYMWDGRLNASIALMIARIPYPNTEVAAKHIIENELASRDAKAYIEATFQRRLKGCNFNPEDSSLSPENGTVDYAGRIFTNMGRCSQCAHRTGNMRVIAPEIASTDVCTKVTCFATKTAKALENNCGQVRLHLRNTYRDDKSKHNIPVLDLPVTAWTIAMESFRIAETAKYIDLDDLYPGQEIKWCEALQTERGLHVAIGVDPYNFAHRLVTKDEAITALRATKHELPEKYRYLFPKQYPDKDPAIAEYAEALDERKQQIHEIASKALLRIVTRRMEPKHFTDPAFLKPVIQFACKGHGKQFQQAFCFAHGIDISGVTDWDIQSRIDQAIEIAETGDLLPMLVTAAFTAAQYAPHFDQFKSEMTTVFSPLGISMAEVDVLPDAAVKELDTPEPVAPIPQNKQMIKQMIGPDHGEPYALGWGCLCPKCVKARKEIPNAKPLIPA